MKERVSLKVIAWGIICTLAVILLGASIGYYTLFLHKNRVADASMKGRHITITLDSNELVEGKFYVPGLEEKAEAEPEAKEEAPTEAGKEAEPEKSTQPAKEQDAAKTEAKQEKPVEKEAQKAVPDNTNNATKVEEKQPAKPVVPPVATKPAASRAKVAILVGGLGLSKSSTERVLSLPAKVSLGFSPYSLDIKEWVAEATKKGHEIFINVPMETAEVSLDDPGSFALVTNLNAEHNLKRLNWVLSRVKGYIGVYTDPTERFSEFKSSIRPVLQDLKKRNLILVYGAGYNNNSFIQMANELAQPVVVSDVAIDATISAVRIKESLAALEQSAKRNGYALGVGTPYPITIKLLEQWLPTLQEKGIELVPASVLLKEKHR